jgi:hypothetical protein
VAGRGAVRVGQPPRGAGGGARTRLQVERRVAARERAVAVLYLRSSCGAREQQHEQRSARERGTAHHAAAPASAASAASARRTAVGAAQRA